MTLQRWAGCLLAGAMGLIAVALLSWGLYVSAQVDSALHLSPAREQNPSDLAPHLGYGMNVRALSNLDPLFTPLDFEWVKLYEQYDARPTERLPHKVLYRLQLNGPPTDLDAWGEHVEAIARAGRGLVEAYEIGNEPNQSWQWGDQVPDPDEYVTALRVAYARIKAVDPQVIVVSGGLGPVGRVQATPAGEGWPGNNGHSMDEWAYARAMFSRCATPGEKGTVNDCFDAFGYHPFGFAYPPETDPVAVPNNFAFRGAEDLRQIMLEYGLEDWPMWATEFGWIRDPDADGYGWCKLQPGFNEPFGWMLVSELEQADYITRALTYADNHWPWMEAMFVWNLDWNDQGWPCSDIRFFSLRHVDGTPTPAYQALMAMDKRPGTVGCRLLAEPDHLTWLTCPGSDCSEEKPSPSTILTGLIAVDSLNACHEITWAVTLHPSSTLRPTLPVTQGRPGQPLTLTIDTAAYLTEGSGTLPLYPTGTYTALLTLSTTPGNVIGAPMTLPIRLIVTPQLYRSYLPLLAQGPF